MAAMAVAAENGGAVAIRASGRSDIAAICKATRLPVIGLVKTLYPNSEISITPTFDEAAEAMEAGAVVVAIDATPRPRPRGNSLAEMIRRIHEELKVPVLADVSTLEEGIQAIELGADAVATTLSGYINESAPARRPDLGLVESLVNSISQPVIAEGRYEVPVDAAQAIELGAHAVVVGTAITRPQVMTERFVSALNKEPGGEG